MPYDKSKDVKKEAKKYALIKGLKKRMKKDGGSQEDSITNILKKKGSKGLPKRKIKR